MHSVADFFGHNEPNRAWLRSRDPVELRTMNREKTADQIRDAASQIGDNERFVI